MSRAEPIAPLSRAARSARVLAVAAALALVPVASAQRADVERAARALIASCAEAGAEAREDILGDVVALGPGAIAVLVETLATDRLDGDPPAPLDADLRARLLGALAALPADHVAAHLRGTRRRPDAPPPELALEILARAGTASCFPLALELATPPPDELGPEPRIYFALQAALAAIVEREPWSTRALIALVPELEPAAQAAAIGGLGSAPSPATLEALSQLLRAGAELEPLVLLALDRVASALEPPFDVAVLARVRPLLDGDEERVALAARALGSLEDAESVEPLIGLLESPSSLVRAAARAGLCRIAGRDFRDEPERWRRWYEAEALAWKVEGPEHVARLGSDESAEVLRAVRALGRGRLFRHERAGWIAACLAHDDEVVVVEACRALAGLGSSTSIMPLAERLGDPSDAVRSAAAKALSLILGVVPPDEPEAWEQLLANHR